MKAPLSWLKEYVDITLTPQKLADGLTEIGVGVEKIERQENDVIFELEITPNRPDLLCITGVAREIAAIERKKVKIPMQSIPKATKKLPFKVRNDYTLLEHYSSIIIADVAIKESPVWLKNRLTQLGLRPINNVVDITNYVMFELGIPLHAFDYDDIHGKEFFIEKSKGGEKFVSVDELSYILPKDAIIIRDADRVVDLVGIKGGHNSGIKNTTKNVMLQTSVDNPVLIRRTSQSLSLRSDASNILEKGIDKNGLLPALYRATNLIIDLAGGTIGSDVIDFKKKDFSPWKLKVRLGKVYHVLGIEIPKNKVLDILNCLNLSPIAKRDSIEVTVPTYRNDLQIEEDLIEEVARMYGYNNFPKSLPIGEIPTQHIPYYKDYAIEQKVKQLFIASGFSEAYTYALVSETDLATHGIKPEHTLRVDNPVSREFEYLRPTLKINLVKALKQNKPNFNTINLFELGKVYAGKSISKVEEYLVLSGISNSKSFYEIKGILERLFTDVGVEYDPTSNIEILDVGVFFEINFSALLEKMKKKKVFIPIPKYPSITEDLAVVVDPRRKIGDMIEEIKKTSSLIVNVSLLDQFQDTKTFHIVYQHTEKNLTDQDARTVREKILKTLKEKFAAKTKA